ncbi:MAG: DUF4256 domain-containing protein [Saprospiraceae bacterium]|nr:DUF4256 domain-containing protein [Saprospiraceae bacterium]
MEQTMLDPEQQNEIIRILSARFEQHPHRHPDMVWTAIQRKLDAYPHKLWSLHEMERTGGEPDVVGYDASTGEFVFFDCSAESPAGRRSVCYDRAGLESRKQHRPDHNAVDMAEEMGVQLMTEQQYRDLQKLGPVDTKTSSWLKTPEAIRQLGGAIFGDYRYGRVFIYHNGAQSYYAARGFRGVLRV